MNKIFRFTGLTVFAAAVLGFSATQGFAQDPCADTDAQTALYNKFTELYPKTDLESRKGAVAAGKEFLEKYGACETVKQQNDYFKTAVPALEKSVKEIQDGIDRKKLIDRFDAAVKGPNADEVFAAGKEILAKTPDNLNVIVAMALVGHNQSTPANSFKYTDDAIRYANLALSKINGGAKFTKKNDKGEEIVGAFWTDRTRPDAIADLSYAVAYLTYFGKKDKTTSLPLFYQLSQGSQKENPVIYGIIGDYYLDQRKPVAEQIRLKLAEQSDSKTAEERKIALEDEIKPLVALFNGYNERILDAYSRAYKVTKDIPANKAYRDNLFKIMQEIYKSRFDKDTGLNEYITATVAKPFPNPSSEVTPVSDPEPVKATTTTTSSPAGTAAAQPASNGKTAVAKPKN